MGKATIQVKQPKIYHETMGEAIQEAFEMAENKGWAVDKYTDQTLWEAMERETYQTKLFHLERSGRISKQCLNITLYRMPSGKYELVTYIN